MSAFYISRKTTYRRFLLDLTNDIFTAYALKHEAWTIEDLAAQADLCPVTVHRLYQKQTKKPSSLTLFKLCRTVGIKLGRKDFSRVAKVTR